VGHLSYIDLLEHVPLKLRQGVHCFSFNRWGGVSKPPFNELNVSYDVGDESQNVAKNLQIIKEFTGIEELLFLKQVHGNDIIFIDSDDREGLIQEADAFWTSTPGKGLMIKHADCQAVVLYDPTVKAVANIHCGWKGNVNEILPKAVARITSFYGSSPGNLWAGISPSLGPCCAEFKEWKTKLPKWLHRFKVWQDHFNFWSASIYQLSSAGVPKSQIFCAQICTACNENYFSYRRDKITGRNGTVVFLK